MVVREVQASKSRRVAADRHLHERRRVDAGRITAFAILLALYGVGEAISSFANLPVPGGVVGMVLLAGALFSGVISIERVEGASDLLLSQLGLLLIPPAVAVLVVFDQFAADWLPMLIGTVGSLLAVLWATSLTTRLVAKRRSADEGRA